MSTRSAPSRWLTLAVASLLVVGGCTDDKPKKQSPNAGVAYSAIVTWFAGRSGTDPDPLKVFIEPMPDGSTVNLDVQAKVIDRVKKVADVHFVDERSEAVTEDSQTGLVSIKDNGVLLSFGPTLRLADMNQVEAFEIEPNDDSAISRTFRVGDDGVLTVSDVIDIEPPDTVPVD